MTGSRHVLKSKTYKTPQRKRDMLAERRTTCKGMDPRRYPTRKSVGYNKARTKQTYTCSTYAKRGPRASRAKQGSSFSKSQMAAMQKEYDDMMEGTNKRSRGGRGNVTKLRKPRKNANAPRQLVQNAGRAYLARKAENARRAAAAAPAAARAPASRKKAPAKKKPIDIPSISVNINTTPAPRTSGRATKKPASYR